MALINVYRYDYYDGVLKRDRRSTDYATGDAIMEMGGTILSDTLQEVDEDLIGDDGHIRADHVFMEPPVKAPVPVAAKTRTRPDSRRAA